MINIMINMIIRNVIAINRMMIIIISVVMNNDILINDNMIINTIIDNVNMVNKIITLCCDL